MNWAELMRRRAVVVYWQYGIKRHQRCDTLEEAIVMKGLMLENGTGHVESITAADGTIWNCEEK